MKLTKLEYTAMYILPLIAFVLNTAFMVGVALRLSGVI